MGSLPPGVQRLMLLGSRLFLALGLMLFGLIQRERLGFWTVALTVVGLGVLIVTIVQMVKAARPK